MSTAYATACQSTNCSALAPASLPPPPAPAPVKEKSPRQAFLECKLNDKCDLEINIELESQYACAINWVPRGGPAWLKS